MNDTYGHDAGDQALRAFSGVLRDSVRPNDIVARYGGEEFVIVFPDCGAEAAAGVLERVREHLALTLSAGRVPAFTVTFGVASTDYAADFDEIVAIADRAARRQGGRQESGWDRRALRAGKHLIARVTRRPVCPDLGPAAEFPEKQARNPAWT